MTTCVVCGVWWVVSGEWWADERLIHPLRFARPPVSEGQFWADEWLWPAIAGKLYHIIILCPFSTSFLKQGLQVLLHNGWFTYLSGTYHHLNELSVLFYAWFNCLKYSSFKHVVAFYAVHLYILRSANIIKLSTQKRKLQIKRKGECFSLMSVGE